MKLIICKGFFNKSATKVFLNKTITVSDIDKILYSCKSTFDAIETGFLLHGHHGHSCRSPDTTKFINRRWLIGIDHRLDAAPQATASNRTPEAANRLQTHLGFQ